MFSSMLLEWSERREHAIFSPRTERTKLKPNSHMPLGFMLIHMFERESFEDNSFNVESMRLPYE